MSAHKYWRVTKIYTRLEKFGSDYTVDVAEVRFLTKEGVLSNNPSKGYSPSALPEYNIIAANAFDGNPATMAGSRNNNSQAVILAWYLSYTFENPVTVIGLGVQMRQDMRPEYGREWQQCDLEYSDDNSNWTKLATLYPRLAQMDISYGEHYLFVLGKYPPTLVTVKTENRVKIPEGSFKPLPAQLTRVKFRFIAFDPKLISVQGYAHYIGNTGYIKGRVTKYISETEEIPLVREVKLFHQKTGTFLGSVWSNEEGYYLFKNLNLVGSYMLVSIDHTQADGAESIAYKKASPVLNTHGTLSYPYLLEGEP